ncbi:MAG TPA: Mpo1-like protein [Burkholderiaceae bacterium]|nr:Mpo1-like protein [Burkholderiaceae bacterium]
MPTVLDNRYHSFAEFYPVYLGEHSNRVCRELHFVGSTLALACFAALLLTENLWWLPAALLCGYGFAWIGHFGFQKNQPATFRQPFYSFMADWVMYWQMLTGQTSF